MKRENAVDQKLYDKGMELRTAVMGKAYVDRALAANQDDIGKPIQDFITEHGWGAVWGREGLSRKTRSMLNLAMLAILNRQHERAPWLQTAELLDHLLADWKAMVPFNRWLGRLP